jgi:rod shape-determining protein MreD
MRWLLPGLLACSIAQAALLSPLSLWGVRPDLFLLLVFFLSLRCGEEAATLQGFFVGLCQDALSGGPLGLCAFTYSLLGFLTARLGRDLYTGNLLAQFWLLLTGCAAAGGITLVLLTFFLGPPPLLTTFLWVIAPEALYTAVVGLLLLRLPHLRAALTQPV